MIGLDNSKIMHGEVALGELLGALGEINDLPLVFYYDGQPVKAGYHVTEVKAGQFSALDCGANPESWSEIFVQLWDIDDDDRVHMSAGKFAAIVRKVAQHVALDDSAKLTFEVSDGARPMQIYQGGHPFVQEGQARVYLSPRAASCKPRDRWLAEKDDAAAATCCGPTAQGGRCCR